MKEQGQVSPIEQDSMGAVGDLVVILVVRL